MSMIGYNGGSPISDLVIILLLDFLLYAMCVYAVLVGENLCCIIFYILATVVLIITVYYATLYFKRIKEAEEAESEK